MTDVVEQSNSEQQRQVQTGGKQDLVQLYNAIKKVHQAKRHSRPHNYGLSCQNLRKLVSKQRINEFLYCAGVPRTEWKNDIRLRMGVEVSAQVLDILQDIVPIATSRAGVGKNVIVMMKDVEYAFDPYNPFMAAKGRAPIFGAPKRAKRKAAGVQTRITNTPTEKDKEQMVKEPVAKKARRVEPKKAKPAAEPKETKETEADSDE